MDDDDDFFDTISVASVPSKKKFNNKAYLSLSRNTIYHSAVDLEGMELTSLDRNGETNSHNKVSSNKNRDVKTYAQWRNRVYRLILVWHYCMGSANFIISNGLNLISTLFLVVGFLRPDLLTKVSLFCFYLQSNSTR